MRQKSRIWWLKLGDHNTAFFHRTVRSHLNNSTLRFVVHPDGTRLTNYEEVTQLAVNYFKNGLGV